MLNAAKVVVYKKVHKVKGREVHKMEDEVTRSDLTLNSTPDHVLADFPASLVTYFSTLWTLSFTI